MADPSNFLSPEEEWDGYLVPRTTATAALLRYSEAKMHLTF
ncbi:hypothetical protein ACPOL_0864 [Acidisarcina polymorpha]|uniref:Uncharacterized protein n=1 Tax=Acidisarcina polymorpha TaxID=2211140 RepID=A0A2Z5FTQ6_9BACT|nr:hypothetical protein ACPOL_0864 [Acidisarcina polymorpha]